LWIVFLVLALFSAPARAAAIDITVRLNFAGAGAVITTDLGYEARIDHGRIVSFAISLVPCPKGDRAGRGGADFFARLRLPSVISSAHAGHVSGLQLGQLVTPAAEALDQASPAIFGRFCRRTGPTARSITLSPAAAAASPG